MPFDGSHKVGEEVFLVAPADMWSAQRFDLPGAVILNGPQDTDTNNLMEDRRWELFTDN